MARPLSTSMRRAMFGASTGEVVVVFIVINHPALIDPIRVCSAGENLVVNSFTYLHFPFELTLAGDDGDTMPEASISICNVDRRIVESVRLVSGEPMSVSVSVALASSPETIEAGPFEFKMRDVEYDSLVVSGRLQLEDLLNEPYPGHAFTPANFPGLF